MTKWQKYEQEKKKIQAKNLTPQEYIKAIRALADRLKL